MSRKSRRQLPIAPPHSVSASKHAARRLNRHTEMHGREPGFDGLEAIEPRLLMSAASVLGDMNGNGQIDVQDINPFVQALVDPQAYQAQHPELDLPSVADLTGDEQVNVQDLNAFITVLGGGSVTLEPGDRMARARNLGVIQPGQTLTAQAHIGDGLYDGKDVDLYRLEVTEPGMFAMRATAPSPIQNQYLCARLFDASGQPLDMTYFFLLYTSNPYSNIYLDAGTYYLGVSGSQNFAYDPAADGSGVDGRYLGDYQLTISDATARPDAGDSMATALDLGTLSIGQTVSWTDQLCNSLYRARDVDLLRLDVATACTLILDINAPWALGGTHPYLRIFDARGDLLTSTEIAEWSTETILYPKTVHELALKLSPGVYFAGISDTLNMHYDPDLTGSGNQQIFHEVYALSLSVVAGPAIDAGESLATATDLGVLSNGDSPVITALIGDSPIAGRDVDLYRLELQNAYRLGLHASESQRPGVHWCTAMRLFDSQGQQLAMTVQQYEHNQDISLQLDAGVYYVGMSGNPNTTYDPTVPSSDATSVMFDLYTLIIMVGQKPETIDSVATTADLGTLDAGGTIALSGRIGQIMPDVGINLYRLELTAARQLTFDIDARVIGSDLDSYLGLFNAAGQQIAHNNNSSDSAPAGFHSGDYDSFLTVMLEPGVYYVSVSSCLDPLVDPTIASDGCGYDFYTLNIWIDAIALSAGLANPSGWTGLESPWDLIAAA